MLLWWICVLTFQPPKRSDLNTLLPPLPRKSSVAASWNRSHTLLETKSRMAFPLWVLGPINWRSNPWQCLNYYCLQEALSWRGLGLYQHKAKAKIHQYTHRTFAFLIPNTPEILIFLPESSPGLIPPVFWAVTRFMLWIFRQPVWLGAVALCTSAPSEFAPPFSGCAGVGMFLLSWALLSFCRVPVSAPPCFENSREIPAFSTHGKVQSCHERACPSPAFLPASALGLPFCF